MEKKMGFTLVELLAVIVILAIILIIAVPGVLSIINRTKDNALDQQKDMIKEASRLYVTSDNDVIWIGQDSKTTVVSLEVLKNKGYLDKKIMDPRSRKEITCAKTTITKTGSKYDYDVTFCDQVNSSPRLSSNMIPIAYDGAKWIKADYTNKNNNWYDYESQQWANMATVTEATREAYKNARIGSEVKMEDINGMYVWIPRFKYKIFNVDGSISPVGNVNLGGEMMIDIQFETTQEGRAKGTQNGEWLTHPAFTFGSEEIEGFWVGKFETGYKGATTTVEAEKNVTDVSKLLVKPDVYSWRGIQTSHMMENAMSMDDGNIFGLTKIEDSHLIKNMEWAAMAYLTYSKYGKSGNLNYSGVEKEVRVNNHSDHLTGCGASSHNAPAESVCNSYQTPQGQAASTTGNITGVYDTSGGAWDVVAAFSKDASMEHYPLAGTGFTQERLDELSLSGQYVDVYTWGIDWYDRSNNGLGNALIEMGPYNSVVGSWYEDYAVLPYREKEPGIARGGGVEDRIISCGTMAFYNWTGVADPTIGYRVTLL